MHNDLKYKIGITLIDGIGDITAKKLIAYCGGVEAVFLEKKSALLKIPDVGRTAANAVVTQSVLSKADREIEFIRKRNINPLFYLDDDYPQRLKYCDDSPVMLYCAGNMDLNRKRSFPSRINVRYILPRCSLILEMVRPRISLWRSKRVTLVP